MYEAITYRKMLRLYRDSLRHGIVNHHDANYKTSDSHKPNALVISKGQQYVGFFYMGEPLSVLHFEEDNVTWKDMYLARVGTPIDKYRVMNDLTTIYDEEKSDHDIRAIKVDNWDGIIL